MSIFMATEKWKQEHQKEMRAYRRKCYAANKDHAKAAVVARKKRLRVWFTEYKSHCACECCGENHPACLVFHHRDPSQKEASLAGVAMKKGWGKEHILAEISKCDVLCANCHRKLHWEEKHKGQ